MIQDFFIDFDLIIQEFFEEIHFLPHIAQSPGLF